MTAYNIVWDTDGEDVTLPNIVKIPDGIKEEDVADYLSDKFGWCILSLNVTNK